MKITVVGAGYVGLSNAVLLAQKHEVVAVDLNEQRVAMLRDGVSPIADAEIEEYLRDRPLQLSATTDLASALSTAEVVIVATPTDYNVEKNFFDTSSVEAVIDAVAESAGTPLVVIKSTIPVGLTRSMRERHEDLQIVFSPEFLREGRALYDNLHPSRIVVGDRGDAGRLIADLLAEGADEEGVPVLLTDPDEAEAIKLFANTYLALRVAYFNELDTYASATGLSAKQIIEGIGLDPRIGRHYNNPSFGYGGYCLPKDTKQLLANFEGIPQNLIGAVVDSNATRMSYVAADILSSSPQTVGVYRLIMKAGSDNFRASAIQVVMQKLAAAGVELVLFEPELQEPKFEGIQVVKDFDEFANRADVIIANRESSELAGVAHKLYTRDIYGRD